MSIPQSLLEQSIQLNIQQALNEDIGDGDITALLTPEHEQATATIITRENMILAGRPWVDALIQHYDHRVKVEWLKAEGEHVQAGEAFLKLAGSARSLLTVERPALNFIQTLSAVATKAAFYVKQLDGLHTKLLDTRKTLPGLRIAQKYAVAIGGGQNHRLGLFDAFLIKENHIMAAGGIAQAIAQARQIAPNKPVEVEVETWNELEQALEAGADIVMLDNFSQQQMIDAVKHVAGRCKLEASGNITLDNLREVATTGVDYISMGVLTKDVTAIDLSMRFNA
ncbi:carboxylating nicotinate-nucleotide diphosphorylase [Acinetobacter sp. UGAL515B_02]|uniref:nicotinate-nucleotide diphosphorylase (carboxylating) n=1 Tax=Acinetobacter soli NIPH 2899 TaxID=1217677 RepID=A0ABN0K0X5_9GAMM|nr:MULTISPECIES: carboxylating nicotinate-nucleotide diphosphorylase [Acinetobacter]ENV61546.1 nicotinate-nucleotide diphosphorylase (carboxylating) [Acinetobacter soli NIPH 2899]MBO3640511.1 carboxylating nicotinate-nucleotide diphosphorylase [Acinetobacter soli]MCB8769210.1 carboxylating nicotinate-nucleotide diphosphorylase [Acinetobacter soli]MCF3128348.1 carboxylating nicotinate-nucleotide diphosphorylase [Acinetobacter soli]MDQ8942359.1 carboxylating nicotinate-nucleotide diphosphorylase